MLRRPHPQTHFQPVIEVTSRNAGHNLCSIAINALMLIIDFKAVNRILERIFSTTWKVNRDSLNVRKKFVEGVFRVFFRKKLTLNGHCLRQRTQR
jgi:hypothetical protein